MRIHNYTIVSVSLLTGVLIGVVLVSWWLVPMYTDMKTQYENIRDVGVEVTNILRGELISQNRRIDNALEFASMRDTSDADRHKDWVIDQMVNALKWKDRLKR